MRKKKRKISNQGGRTGRSLAVLGHVCLWAALGVLAYWAWLDKEVYETFESASWSLPAKVYARPMDVYSGAPISPGRFVYELDNLGYESVATVTAPGQYERARNTIRYYSRGYKFWDGEEKSNLIQVDFLKEVVKQVTSVVNGEQINITRTEPIVIGSINPKSYEDRILLEYTDLPEILIGSLVAVEDHRFYHHHGFDLFGLFRAIFSNIKAGAYVQGGSTLTQQLVKNFYLTRERSLRRKITELLMAISLEFRFPKKKILEVYTNEVFLGQDGNRAIHGFGLASQFYFGKPLNELDIPSIACLVGMVKGPSAYNPKSHLVRAKQRRDFVLAVMEKRGLISEEQLDSYRNSPLKTKNILSGQTVSSLGFLDLVKRQLKEQYNQVEIIESGLKIYTSLDPYIQGKAAVALKSSVRMLEEASVYRDDLQAASVVIDPSTGEILSLLGGVQEVPGGFNRALDAKRHVGSMIKPFVYASALANPEAYSLITLLRDKEIKWKLEDGTIWSPKNFDGKARGNIPLINSLTDSLNLATVNLGSELGIDYVTEFLKKIGLPKTTKAYPSILLGAVQLSPVEMAGMYTMFVNDGFSVPLRSILEVTTNRDEIIKRYPIRLEPAIEPTTSFLIRHALISVMDTGTGRTLKKTFDIGPVGGKTGTSDDYRDSWFVGFGRNLLGIVWLGRDDNLPMGLTGSAGALQVWSKIMPYSNLAPVSSVAPPGIIMRSVDLFAGKVVPKDCPNAELVPFNSKTVLPMSDRCLKGSERRKRGPRAEVLHSRGEEKEIFRWFRRLFD